MEQDHVAIHLVEEILEEEGMGGEELLCCHSLKTEKLYTGRRETRGMIRFKPVLKTGLELEVQVDLYIVSTLYHPLEQLESWVSRRLVIAPWMFVRSFARTVADLNIWLSPSLQALSPQVVFD